MSVIYGQLVDEESRCLHYHGQTDILSLKCYECGKYYACYQCHNKLEEHLFSPYPIQNCQDKVVICGVCKMELTFGLYHENRSCPNCHSSFNPACRKHYHLYFK
ncbi:CHY zinc finger protein [Streptococcus sp. DD10]|uniref:CHY zinc finger protein n=1 Tax=Streptococcus sp. DD10 TaxID=1777878 RepID=UPI0009ED7F37|nr:CHY zinc finger protein [Streptococcus sp. DD10]